MDYLLFTPTSAGETELNKIPSINSSYSKPLIDKYESFSDDNYKILNNIDNKVDQYTPDLAPSAPPLNEHLVHIDHLDVPTPKDDSQEGKDFRKWMMFRAIIAEFIATMIFLVVNLGTLINLNLNSSSQGGIVIQNAVACGFTAIAMIYSFAEISGAHFNPAVTFATWLAGKVSNRKALFFMLAQLAGRFDFFIYYLIKFLVLFLV